jgi:DUF1680 family protein
MVKQSFAIVGLFLSCFSLHLRAAPLSLSVTWVRGPDTEERNAHYVTNREPLLNTPFFKLPVGAIEPQGWVRKQLELEAEGFTGHLTELSGFLRKEGNAWLSPTGEGERGWEEVPYWLKGYANLAYVLGDKKMLDETRLWIEGALGSQKADGWFGPDQGRKGAATRLQGREDLWPNAIMLFCLMDYYSYTADPRVIELMTNYADYLKTVPEERFLVGYWPKMRGGDLLMSVYWLYNHTGDKELLDLAQKVHRCTARWDEDVINWHNVNMSQAFGEPGTYYLQSRNPVHLAACERNYRKIRTLYGQVPGGMFGGDENCRPGYSGPRQAIETCGIVEMMLSHETLLWISGAVKWADRCEDVTFNSLPASMTADMKALRYLTAPNMVLSDSRNKAPGIQNGGPMFHMNPHGHRCCQHNSGHGWPYYAQHLWMGSADNGLAAMLYAASTVTARVGSGQAVTIRQSTHYPFEEAVLFDVTVDQPVAFPLYLRIPGWCTQARVKVNGQGLAVPVRPEGYVRIERRWQDGDRVYLELPMSLQTTTWRANMDSVSVHRGPLTFSLKIDEQVVRNGGTDAWPAWDIRPASAWNYGLSLKPGPPTESFRVIHKGWPPNHMPFTQAGNPIEIRAQGCRIEAWTVDHRGLIQEIQPSPIAVDTPVEELTLIPMGAARLRISAFPRIAAPGQSGHIWEKLPEPQASHVHDAYEALRDGQVPENSNDHSIPRFTWWDHRGTEEWVNIVLPEAMPVAEVSVYWFDDTGQGQCRVPRSWSLLYEDSEGMWLPVEDPGDFHVARDAFNTVRFKKVTTGRLRIQVQLQPRYSGGILEVQVQ